MKIMAYKHTGQPWNGALLDQSRQKNIYKIISCNRTVAVNADCEE